MTRMLSQHPPAPHPRHRLEPRAAPRDRADPGRPDLAAVRHRRQGRGGADRLACPASRAGRSTASPRARRKRSSWAFPCLALFPNTPAGLRSDDGGEALNPDNLMCRAIRAIRDACGERYRRADRCRARSLYQPRAGRAGRRCRLCRQRRHRRGAGRPGGQPGRGRGRHHRPVGHDGRPDRARSAWRWRWAGITMSRS